MFPDKGSHRMAQIDLGPGIQMDTVGRTGLSELLGIQEIAALFPRNSGR